jgi:hypothetical protein
MPPSLNIVCKSKLFGRPLLVRVLEENVLERIGRGAVWLLLGVGLERGYSSAWRVTNAAAEGIGVGSAEPATKSGSGGVGVSTAKERTAGVGRGPETSLVGIVVSKHTTSSVGASKRRGIVGRVAKSSKASSGVGRGIGGSEEAGTSVASGTKGGGRLAAEAAGRVGSKSA